jgi:hypothetical protein
VVKQLKDVVAEVPKSLTGHDPKWLRKRNQKCIQCKWEGHEGQLKPLPALMGGYYPGECPSCGAKNLLFGRDNIESAEGYAIVLNPEFREEPNADQ